ncbi:MAG: hypothetical protein WKF91_05270 [Segetibacter sp.]
MSDASVLKEAELRGIAIRLAVTMESVLMNIVYSSNSEQYFISPSPSLKLKGLMFSHKIERVKEVLQKYHPDLLEEYNQLFIDLKDFKEFRNQIAHCVFSWGSSITEFEIWEVAEDENKFQFYKPVKCSVYDAYKVMAKAIEIIIPPLTKLLQQVEDRLKVSDRQLFDILKQVDNFPPSN